MHRYARPVWYLLCFFCLLPVFSAPSKTAQDQVSRALAAADATRVQTSLEGALARTTNPSDIQYLLSSLASFHERTGRPDLAALRFQEAAQAAPTDGSESLLLDAARCALSGGDTVLSDTLVRKVMLTSFSEPVLIRARLYSAWIQLSTSSSAQALSLLRDFSRLPSYSPWLPAILFTLWWSDSDVDALSRLKAECPTSVEASIVTGSIQTAPVPFWYLMARNQERVNAFAREGSQDLAGKLAARSPEPPAKAEKPQAPKVSSSSQERLWQQVGFFKNVEYAQELSMRLKKLGFSCIIREEKRPSGTTYYSVLVSEDASHGSAARLKDAGYESFLVIE